MGIYHYLCLGLPDWLVMVKHYNISCNLTY